MVNETKKGLKEKIERLREKLLSGQECREPYWMHQLAMGKIENKEAFKKSLDNYPNKLVGGRDE